MVVVAAAFLPLGVSGYILGLLTIAYYFGVFSMAWDLLFGFAGEVNFGPTFLIGTGAYTAGILDNLYGAADLGLRDRRHARCGRGRAHSGAAGARGCAAPISGSPRWSRC